MHTSVLFETHNVQLTRYLQLWDYFFIFQIAYFYFFSGFFVIIYCLFFKCFHLLGIGQRKAQSSSQSFVLPVLVTLRLISWCPHWCKVNKRNFMFNIFVKLVLKLKKRCMKDRMVTNRKQCQKQLSRCALKGFKTRKHYIKGCVKATGLIALRVINQY